MVTSPINRAPSSFRPPRLTPSSNGRSNFKRACFKHRIAIGVRPDPSLNAGVPSARGGFAFKINVNG